MPTCLTAGRYDHGKKSCFNRLDCCRVQEGKMQPISTDASANLETVLVDFALQAEVRMARYMGRPRQAS